MTRPHAPLLLVAVALSLVVGGCKRKPALLVPVKDRKAFQRRVMQAVKGNRARICPRPVLRGQASEGAVATDVAAIVEGDADTARCLAVSRKRTAPLERALYLSSKEHPEGLPDRSVARPFPTGAQAAADVVATARACQPLFKRLRRVALRRNGCSPYLAGVRCNKNWFSATWAGRAVAAQARLSLLNGRTREGITVLLDLLRLSQDMERGGTSWLVVGAAQQLASSHAVPMLERVLNGVPGLTPALLKQVQRELQVLLNSEPHPASSIRAEYQSVVLGTVLPQFAGASWKPPGVGCAVKLAAPKESRGTRRSLEAWQDIWALHALVHEQMARDMGLVCPASATPMFCERALQRLTDRYRKQSVRAFPRLKERLSSVKARRRDPGFTALLGLAGVNARYVRAQATRRVYIAALRLSAAFRGLVVAKQACPGPAAFDAEPLKSLRRDPYSGAQLAVKQLAPGRYLVSSPKLSKASGADKGPGLLISCK